MSRKSATTSFLVSLVLHALVLASIALGFARPSGGAERVAALLQPRKTVRFQFVDLPAGPRAKPDAPRELVAERDARAADRAPRSLPEGAPYSEGRTSLPNPTPGEGGRGGAATGARPPALDARAPSPRSGGSPARSGAGTGAGKGDAAAAREPAGEAATRLPAGADGERVTPRTLRARLGDSRLDLPRRDLATAPPSAGTAGGGGAPGLPQVDNRLSRARYDGDFSLSTYAWDYAPYMSRLKRRIESYTWTILPSAFWYGIAAWATQVRFVILPDGRLESVLISGHRGVRELRYVAPDAVTGAAGPTERFEALPPGFPEPKLVVTGNFYFNLFPPGADRDSLRGAQRETP